MPAQAVDPEPPQCVDLTRDACPVTFLKAKLHIERLAPGEAIELALADGPTLRDLPRSIKDDGHRIERVRREGNTVFLLVRKAADV